jgi:hypothetical protein
VEVGGFETDSEGHVLTGFSPVITPVCYAYVFGDRSDVHQDDVFRGGFVPRAVNSTSCRYRSAMDARWSMSAGSNVSSRGQTGLAAGTRHCDYHVAVGPAWIGETPMTWCSPHSGIAPANAKTVENLETGGNITRIVVTVQVGDEDVAKSP